VLGDKDAIATIAVKDVNVAKKFYEDTARPEAGTRSGIWRLVVQERTRHGPGLQISIRWNKPGDSRDVVGRGNIEGVVQSLKAKGVVFEHYDLPASNERAMSISLGKTKAAWFKIPTATFSVWSVNRTARAAQTS